MLSHPTCILFLTLSVVVKSTNVFQGDCSSETVLCEQLCITLSPETYECSCWEGHLLQDDGLSCKVDTNIQYSVENLAPTTTTKLFESHKTTNPSKFIEQLNRPLSFKGNNYAEFPIDDSTYLETNITVQFRLEERKDGIILFAGQLAGDDFLSITRDGPNIITRHDCGEGTIEDMYHGTFEIGEWHEITIWRKNCDNTQMRVDRGRRLVDIADEFKNYKGITIDEGVFIGGAPNNIEYLREKTGYLEGFRGCVRMLIINGQVLLDTRNGINNAINNHELYYCSENEHNVRNDTLDKIEMFDLTQRGIPMIAETPKATQPVHLTTEDPEVSTEFSLSNGIIIEALKLFYEKIAIIEDKKKEKPISNWKIAHFNGSSKISMPAPNSILSYLELSIQFKTESPSGILFFWQENSKFLAVSIESSFVRVYASLGADTTIIRSENAISLYHWHKLEVWRSGKGILLKINRQNWVESELHSERSQILEDTGIIHIGSFDGFTKLETLKNLPGFEGCVKKIRLNGKSVSLSNFVSIGISECSSDPCLSYGCPAKCISHNSQPICSCEWPKIGEKCALSAESDLSAMSFNGFSYLELDEETARSHITGETLDLAVNFKLRNFNSHLRQILVSAGDSSQEDDFFELSIDSNRFARFAINLGAGTVVMVHPKRIEDERWTTVEVIRKKQEIKLSVNGEDPISAYAPEGAQQLNVYRNIFVGNSNPSDYTDSREFTGLHGCIISSRFDEIVISHPKNAKTAINIEDCAI